MLAVSPNTTLFVFGKNGSAKDAVVVLKNPPSARPACDHSLSPPCY